MTATIPPEGIFLDAIAAVCEATGRTAPQRVYEDLRAGLMTRPVKICRSSRWPRHEHQAIAAARIAGASDDELRALVEELHAARTLLMPRIGMRWFKCDFQVQTPEDAAHWGDENTRLPEPRRPMVQPAPDANGAVGPARPDESRLQELARVYLRRCHEVGLELIGVTDHNFSQKTDLRDWFLTHLVEQNKAVARELGRPPLYILPGFEVDIGYHVLCLFEPATKASHVWRVNRLLCKLGLDENERFRHGRPMPLRRNNAIVSLKELLELVQDERKGIVIAAHSDQNDGLLDDARHIEDYKNKSLLALEVTANPPPRRVLDIVEGRDHTWARSDSHPGYGCSAAP